MLNAKTSTKTADDDEKIRLMVGGQIASLLDQVIANTTISSRSQAASMVIGRMTKTFIQTWVYEFNPSPPNLLSATPPPSLVLPDTQFMQNGATNPSATESIDLESLFRPMEY